MTSYTFEGLVGSIDRIDVFESCHVISRRVDIWTPPSYLSDTKQKYKVLYMHDGENVFDNSTSKWSHEDWGIDETITRLMTERKIAPTMVVAMWSTDIRAAEYMPQKLPDTPAARGAWRLLQKWNKEGICSDNYLRFIVQEVKPYVDSHYRTLTGPKDTAIMGASMGGLISMYAMCEYPQVFGGAGCVSTHWPIGRGIVLKYLRDHMPDPQDHKFYFDFGTRTVDKTYEHYQRQADKILAEGGYQQPENWLTRKFEGHMHSEIDWRKRVHIPLEFLLK